MKIAHFGVGRIGMGLIIPFFSSTFDLYAIDRKKSHIEKLKENGYRLLDNSEPVDVFTHISKFKPIHIDDIDIIGNVDIIITSVIERNLPDIIPYIVKILKKCKTPTYIIPMENSFNAIDIIRKHLELNEIDVTKLIFLRSVIDRIIPRINSDNNVICEKYSSIKIEYHFGLAEVLGSDTLSKDIAFDFEKKFLLVNGLHACAAYLGFLKRFKYIHESVNCIQIENKLKKIGLCYLEYLNFKYSKNINSIKVKHTLDRFKNSFLGDEVSRVGRNLLIKLDVNGRINGPLIYNKSKGLLYEPLLEVVAAASKFSIAEDYDLYLKKIK